MPIILILVGALFLVLGVRDTQSDFISLIETDIPAFGVWFVAIFAVGAIGYIPRLKPISDAFLVLVILVIFIANGKQGQGFFAKFQQAIGRGSGSSLSGSSIGPGAVNAGNGVI